MAEPIAPRAASLPIVFRTSEAVGFTVQAWRAPADGWVPLGESQRFATEAEATSAAAALAGEHNGTLAMLLFPPGYAPPNFRRRK